ncbi:hypothetical protein [Krasilnikovia sp. MM14-A1259]|uniref:hypothetical protein n=1 Tax=Krasilnikovia sp. MM14-A1259 TaxID=3373539 RepID=UPI00399CF3EE
MGARARRLRDDGWDTAAPGLPASTVRGLQVGGGLSTWAYPEGGAAGLLAGAAEFGSPSCRA